MCALGVGVGMAGGPRNALYNKQCGAFKISPLLPALSWTHIKVGELDPVAPPPQPQSYGRTRYSESSGMKGVGPCLSKGEDLLWGKILLSHCSSFPATSRTTEGLKTSMRANLG